MQVNNNVSAQNFGMALKLRSFASDYLEKQSKNTLETLEKLGEEFKDYKHWDLVVDKQGYHVVGKGTLGDQYAKIGKPDADERFITDHFTVPVKCEKFADKGKIVQRYMNYSNHDAAVEGYNKIKNASSDLDRTAAFVRELETISAQKAYEEAAKNAADAEKTAKIDELIHKFATEE